jgi:phage baseplate assembly protein W
LPTNATEAAITVEMVFAVNSSTTASEVAEEVREALLMFEPRIDILGVEVTEGGGQGEVLYISVDYQVRETNNVFNLVYPFYLERSAA